MTAKIIGTGGTAVTTTDPISAFVDFKMEGNPFIAWLVYRGGLYSSNAIDPKAVGFSYAWYQFFRSPGREQRYALEIELEKFRREKFPNAISRLDGFFLFPSEEIARQAAAQGSGFSVTKLHEVEVAPRARISCYDMDWVTYNSSNRSAGNGWFRDYFAGNPRTSNPTWEYVVEGRARIVTAPDSSEVFRIVDTYWPGCRGVLESSRKACKRGDDGGAILPLLSADGSQLHFEVKEVTPSDPALTADWPKLRSYLSRYTFPVH